MLYLSKIGKLFMLVALFCSQLVACTFITSDIKKITPSPEISFLPSLSSDIYKAFPHKFEYPSMIIEEIECGDLNDNGNILFLRDSEVGSDKAVSDYDLMIMNGNGCFPRVIMKNVSGSPAWSKDWEKIAIGCDGNTALCILDASETLRNCTIQGKYDEGQCVPAIQSKYTLPLEISEGYHFNNISWSMDSLQIVVSSPEAGYLLTLTDKGTWEIYEDLLVSAEWSPVENLIAVDGIYLFDPGTQKRTKIITGRNPEWSLDGTRIVFLKKSKNEIRDRHFMGIAVVNIHNGELQWVYEPHISNESDKYYFPYDIGDASMHRVLSWSPTERYISVVARYTNDYDHQIFRLDLVTGEIVVLSENLTFVDADPRFYAPAWGP